MNTFDELCSKEITEILKKKNITTPTPVQISVIQKIIEGQDIITTARTGSGKTFAYLIPLINSIDENIKTPQILILTPTHELASQVYNEAKFLDKELSKDINPALLIGGSNINKQLEKLKEKPKIIIGSSGRILELVKLKKLKMHTIKTIVLDEGDRLLDDLNFSSTESVIKSTLRDRQLLYFSASIDEKTLNVLNSIMKHPERVIVDNEKTIPENISHYYFLCEKRDKIDTVRKIVNGLNLKKVMIFVNNPYTIDTVSEKLNYHKLKSIGLHGANKKSERKVALQKFKDTAANILVTSDLTCRGLDIADVDCVINFDIPETHTFYQHRSGRTGRSNKIGMCISIATNFEVTHLNKFSKFFNINIDKKTMSYGKMVSETIKNTFK